MVECWRFHRPQCGFGDTERGHLARDHEMFCEICFEEDGIRIRLRRWLDEDHAAQDQISQDQISQDQGPLRKTG